MKKNARLYIRITTELLDKLKLEAEEHEMHLAELCRKKLGNDLKLNRIESLILEINKKLTSSQP